MATTGRNRDLGLGPREQIEIAEVMQRIGPYVVLGRPGEKLPEVGAAKLYVDDADWQPKILEWLQKVRLVVLQAGTTPGLRWAMGRMVNRLSPAKLLVVLPETDAQDRQFKGVGRRRAAEGAAGQTEGAPAHARR